MSLPLCLLCFQFAEHLYKVLEPKQVAMIRPWMLCSVTAEALMCGMCKVDHAHQWPTHTTVLIVYIVQEFTVTQVRVQWHVTIVVILQHLSRLHLLHVGCVTVVLHGQVLVPVGAVIHDEQWARVEAERDEFRQCVVERLQLFYDRVYQFRAQSVAVLKEVAQRLFDTVRVKASTVVFVVADEVSSVALVYL